jgi:copper resistance protein C
VVTVHFAQHVNPQGSNILVYDATHKQVSTAPATVVTSDLKTMTVPMKGDGDGIYLVEWHTVSADDGDADIGAFNFTVSASGKANPSAGPPSHAATGSSGVSCVTDRAGRSHRPGRWWGRALRCGTAGGTRQRWTAPDMRVTNL